MSPAPRQREMLRDVARRDVTDAKAAGSDVFYFPPPPPQVRDHASAVDARGGRRRTT